MIETPELDKLIEVEFEHEVITEFLEGLQDMGLTLCQKLDIGQGEQYYHYPMAIEDLLARYFKIDLDKIEQERRAILAILQQ